MIILIIAFEGLMRDLLAKLFTSRGFPVTVASTGMEGLKVLKKNPVKMVIADLETPDLKPSKIIKIIKKSDNDSLVAVIHPQTKRHIKMPRGLEADLSIKRPLDMDGILRVVSDALARRCSDR